MESLTGHANGDLAVIQWLGTEGSQLRYRRRSHARRAADLRDADAGVIAVSRLLASHEGRQQVDLVGR